MNGVDNVISANKKKYNTFIQSWPKVLQNYYQSYILKRNSQNKYDPSNCSLSTIPFWLKLPILISFNYTKSSKTKNHHQSFLKDILWAQNCIFLFMRIQDDVIDESTIDKKLMEAADILPYEQVQVLNIDNGNRFTTYAIEGVEGSGQICINGAAARLATKGDTVIILSYCHVEETKARHFVPKLVYVNDKNAITETKGVVTAVTAWQPHRITVKGVKDEFAFESNA